MSEQVLKPQSGDIVLPYGDDHIYSPDDYLVLRNANPSHHFLRASLVLPIAQSFTPDRLLGMAYQYHSSSTRFIPYNPDIVFPVTTSSARPKFIALSAVSNNELAGVSVPFDEDYYWAYRDKDGAFAGAALSEHLPIFTREPEFTRLAELGDARIAILGCATPLNYLALLDEMSYLGIEADIDVYDISEHPIAELAPYCRPTDRTILADATQLHPSAVGQYDAVFADFLLNCINPTQNSVLMTAIRNILAPDGHLFMSYVTDVAFQDKGFPNLPGTITAEANFSGQISFYMQDGDLLGLLGEHGMTPIQLGESLNKKLAFGEKRDHYYVCYLQGV